MMKTCCSNSSHVCNPLWYRVHFRPFSFPSLLLYPCQHWACLHLSLSLSSLTSYTCFLLFFFCRAWHLLTDRSRKREGGGISSWKNNVLLTHQSMLFVSPCVVSMMCFKGWRGYQKMSALQASIDLCRFLNLKRTVAKQQNRNWETDLLQAQR